MLSNHPGEQIDFVVASSAAATEALHAQLCSIGQVVEYVDLADADHGTEPVLGADEISAWLADRLAGELAMSTCAA